MINHYKNKGYTIEIDLSRKYGYKNYAVQCTYKYDKKKGKYSLSMWLKRKDVGDTYKIDSQEVDTQYISGTKETIIDNICRIVEQASIAGFFNEYIKRYEYMCKCFEIGDEILTKELVSNAS